MRCDDIRKAVAEGAPFDDDARAHLASCDACGEEFAELRALTAARTDAPPALRGRVLEAFPARTSAVRSFPLRAAALFLLGLTVGFAAAFAARPTRVEIVERPVEKKVEVVKEVEKPLSEDLLSNVGIAAQRVYGDLVRVTYKPRSVEIRKILVSPIVQTYEKYCPVARQLHRCSELRPDLVEYAKSDSAPDPEQEPETPPDTKKREY